MFSDRTPPWQHCHCVSKLLGARVLTVLAAITLAAYTSCNHACSSHACRCIDMGTKDACVTVTLKINSIFVIVERATTADHTVARAQRATQ